MYLLGLGIVLLILKLMELTFVAQWPWWQVMIPFGLTIVWWMWADHSGYYSRREMEKLESRRQARIKRAKDDLMRPANRR